MERRRDRCLPWRARPGLAARGGGRRSHFSRDRIGPWPIARCCAPPTPPAAPDGPTRTGVARRSLGSSKREKSARRASHHNTPPATAARATPGPRALFLLQRLGLL